MDNTINNQRLFNIGIRLVKFAWTVEIVAVLIGFLISIIVSYSVYFQIDRADNVLTFGDYSTILVAGLPFVLVGIVEATKIPVATALMYAKHTSWRIVLFIGLIFLAMITFETMVNGFERNFSNLTLSIDEKKSKELLIQHTIESYELQKKRINVINPYKVNERYKKTTQSANQEYNKKIVQQREYTQKQIHNIGNIDRQKIDKELQKLHNRENEIYEKWDAERKKATIRLRNLVNKNITGSSSEKEKLEKELKNLKAEMKRELDDSNFLTRPAKEKKYRALIDKKEQRLYKVSDYAIGNVAINQQTESEKQLQEHLRVLGENYQRRIDTIRSRISYLNKTLQASQQSNEFLLKKYEKELKLYTDSATRDRDSIINKASKSRSVNLREYTYIQSKVKDFNKKIEELKTQQREIHYRINRLVNQNQIYRVSSYISGKENAIEVPKEMVGTVALVWFGSLAFICSLAGVFLAIAGIYIQKIYSDEYIAKELEMLNNKNA